jgi:hypothetical protein
MKLGEIIANDMMQWCSKTFDGEFVVTGKVLRSQDYSDGTEDSWFVFHIDDGAVHVLGVTVSEDEGSISQHDGCGRTDLTSVEWAEPGSVERFRGWILDSAETYRKWKESGGRGRRPHYFD